MPITWKNVNAPSNAGVANLIKTSSDMLDRGVSGVTGAINSYDTRKTKESNDGVSNFINSFDSEEAFNKATQDGSLSIEGLSGAFGNRFDKGTAQSLLNSRIGKIRDKATSEYNYQNTLTDRADKPIFDTATAGILGAYSQEDFDNLKALAGTRGLSPGAQNRLALQLNSAQDTFARKQRDEAAYARTQANNLRSDILRNNADSAEVQQLKGSFNEQDLTSQYEDAIAVQGFNPEEVARQEGVTPADITALIEGTFGDDTSIFPSKDGGATLQTKASALLGAEGVKPWMVEQVLRQFGSQSVEGSDRYLDEDLLEKKVKELSEDTSMKTKRDTVLELQKTYTTSLNNLRINNLKNLQATRKGEQFVPDNTFDVPDGSKVEDGGNQDSITDDLATGDTPPPKKSPSDILRGANIKLPDRGTNVVHKDISKGYFEIRDEEGNFYNPASRAAVEAGEVVNTAGNALVTNAVARASDVGTAVSDAINKVDTHFDKLKEGRSKQKADRLSRAVDRFTSDSPTESSAKAIVKNPFATKEQKEVARAFLDYLNE